MQIEMPARTSYMGVSMIAYKMISAIAMGFNANSQSLKYAVSEFAGSQTEFEIARG